MTENIKINFVDVNIEKDLKEEWPAGRSAGAAARQFIRVLGCSDKFPTLQKLLEELLAASNRQSFDRSCILRAFDDAAPEAAKIARRGSFKRNNLDRSDVQS